MENAEITKQVRQAEDQIIQLAKEKKKAVDAASSADRLISVAEEQIKVLKSSSKSLESLSETLATSAEATKSSITSIYKDASKSLKESTARLEEIREDSRNLDARFQAIEDMMKALSISLDENIFAISEGQIELNDTVQSSYNNLNKNLQARSDQIQNQLKSMNDQMAIMSKSTIRLLESTKENKKMITYALLAAIGALVVAAIGLLRP